MSLFFKVIYKGIQTFFLQEADNRENNSFDCEFINLYTISGAHSYCLWMVLYHKIFHFYSETELDINIIVHILVMMLL